MIALTAATTQEVNGLCRCISRQPRTAGGGYETWSGRYKDRELLIIRSGVGKQKAENAMNTVLESHPISTLVSLGFAGALVDDLGAGSIVLCDGIHHVNGSGMSLFHADTDLLRRVARAMEKTGLDWRSGGGLTVIEPVFRAEEKRELGENIGARICDMEDYWLAQAAAARGIPFLAVRVVFDDIRSHLLDFDKIGDEEGNVSAGRMISYLLARPGHLLRAPSLYRSFNRAQASLARATEILLDAFYSDENSPDYTAG